MTNKIFLVLGGSSDLSSVCGGQFGVGSFTSGLGLGSLGSGGNHYNFSAGYQNY